MSDFDMQATEKRTEFLQIAEESILNDLLSTEIGPDLVQVRSLATAIIDAYIDFSLPKHQEDIFNVLSLSQGGIGGAKSVKPANFLLDMGNLMTAVAGSVLTLNGLHSSPWTAPFIAIVIWNRVWSGLKVDVSEREAAVLWTLWKHSDGSKHVPVTELLALTNAELTIHGRNSINQQELDASLDILLKMGCVGFSLLNSDQLWLREWVKVSYK